MSNIKAGVNVKIEVQGIEKVSELLKKHYDLLGAIEENLCQIYNARLELEIKLNQPSFELKESIDDCPICG